MINLNYDFTELPKHNIDYFIPLKFYIDPDERAAAEKGSARQLELQYGHSPVGQIGRAHV